MNSAQIHKHFTSAVTPCKYIDISDFQFFKADLVQANRSCANVELYVLNK